MKSFSQICSFFSLIKTPSNDFYFDNLILDSRETSEKSVFIALKGLSSDGNKYIQDVINSGVKLVLSDNEISDDIYQQVIYIDDLKSKLADLAQWFYDYKKPNLVVGITGTNGKTSISSYVAQLLDLQNNKTLLLGTNGNGIYPNLEESTHTTLDILSLYKKISQYKDIDNLVMEVSSHSLDQQRVKGLGFDVAVFSNISHDHLDYHLTMENYFLAKAKLFQKANLTKAVINIDDDYGKRLCELTIAPIITVSLHQKNADICIIKKLVSTKGTSFTLYQKGNEIGQYTTKLIGEFNLMNLALSLAVMTDMTKSLENIVNISAVKGRMEKIALANGASIIIDYAHTPDALEKALQTLREYTKNKLWCIFGCGGNRDKSKRSLMANTVEKWADTIVVTEDNNRFENIKDIFVDIQQGFRQQHKFIANRELAINYAVENSQSGDIILLAGKGHECYLDKNGTKEHFDEREIVAKYGY